MWRIEWKNKCDVCNRPLNVRVIFPKQIDSFFILKFILCTTVYNLNLENNKRYIKFTNRKKTYMCEYCFKKGYMNINHIIQREIYGKKNNINKAWTEDDLYEWCEKVYRILSNETCNWSDFLDHYEYIDIYNVELYRGRRIINHYDLLV